MPDEKNHQSDNCPAGKTDTNNADNLERRLANYELKVFDNPFSKEYFSRLTYDVYRRFPGLWLPETLIL